MLRWIVGTAVCLSLAASATWVQKAQIHPRIDRGLNEDLLYLPNENLITHFTGGLSGVLADLLWIRTISYASQEFKSADKKFTWLEHMVRMVTRLDPYYEDAYVNGAMLLSSLGQDNRSLPLLQDGLIRMPHSAKIPNEIVSIYLLNRRDQPGASAMTLHYGTILMNNSSNPEYYAEWLDRIRATNSLEGEARRVWTDLLETSKDEFIRELALAQLNILDAEAGLNVLREAAERFEQARGQRPETVEAVLGFMGSAAPRLHEALGTYYMAPDGSVRNTMLDAVAADRARRLLAARLLTYERRNGRRPESLEALKEAIPRANIKHPVPGYRWDYDPETGEVTEAPALDVRE